MSGAIDRLRTARDGHHALAHVWPADLRDVLADLDAAEISGDHQRTRADAAEADRDALRAECERLRAIYEAADEFLFCDYAAEVESYSETSPGSHAASQARASEAWNALVRLRDAERELRLATLPACASAPAGVVAAEAATRAVTGHAALAGAVRAECERLRAIVEGSTTAPTDAEMREHMDSGGAWLVTIPARRQVRLHPETRYVDQPRAASLLWWTEGARWVAVRDGRPCAWPVTPPTARVALPVAAPVYEPPGCHSDDDGDCVWAECPQLRDNEPRATGRHCPRDLRGDE